MAWVPAYLHLLRARDAIDRRYAEPLDVATLARTALASEAHFARSFRRAFGETPGRYLQRRRIERAADLLRETDRPVTQVCLDVGFTSLGSFGNAFRALMGEPPSAYRDRHRGAPPPQVPACFTLCGPGPWREQSRRSRTARTALGSRHDQPALPRLHLGARPGRGARVLHRQLGFEVRTDQTMDDFRWLTVSPPDQPQLEIALLVPRPPMMDADAAGQIKALVSKGALGNAVFATRLPPNLRGAQGARRRVHPGAGRALLRHRGDVPRQLGQLVLAHAALERPRPKLSGGGYSRH